MMKPAKHTCNVAKGTKCVSCQRKSLKSNMYDFTLCEDDLDLIVGGMDSDDLQKVMELAAADMDLETLTPTSYFKD
ncbi:hypothetical protein [uncultured Dokdonia sp.]|uniref:hypothetical protein n=1 Tax=uncultured Dokdonia sp. TaxID=575653 RepID=UPI002619E025|nr:hypothetical protein [uncultured Dokdonia sp.]